MRNARLTIATVLGVMLLQEESLAQRITRNAETAKVQEAFNERFLKSGERVSSIQICVTVDAKEGERLDSLPAYISDVTREVVSEKHTVQGVGVVIRSNHCFALIFEKELSAERAVELSRKLGALDFVTDSSPVGYLKINAITTNDPYLASQWYLGSIGVEAAWKYSRGDSNVIVAVVDMGINLQQIEFTNRVLPGRDFVQPEKFGGDGDGWDADPTDVGSGVSSSDVSTEKYADCPISDSLWHGTSIAGVIAAEANNSVGVVGIAPGISILPVRVYGKCEKKNGSGFANLQNGLLWAMGVLPIGSEKNLNIPQVLATAINAKIPCPQAISDTISEARKSGVLTIAAAGNEGEQGGQASDWFPGNCRDVIAVGASTEFGRKAKYSNLGSTVDIMAPSGDGDITLPDKNSQGLLVDAGAVYPTGNPALRQAIGTSYAMPQVAAAAALAFSFRSFAGRQPTTNEVADYLLRTARNPSDGRCPTSDCGNGILDIAASTSAAAVSGYVFSRNLQGELTELISRSGSLEMHEHTGIVPKQISRGYRIGGFKFSAVYVLTENGDVYVSAGRARLDNPVPGIEKLVSFTKVSGLVNVKRIVLYPFQSFKTNYSEDVYFVLNDNSVRRMRFSSNGDRSALLPPEDLGVEPNLTGLLKLYSDEALNSVVSDVPNRALLSGGTIAYKGTFFNGVDCRPVVPSLTSYPDWATVPLGFPVKDERDHYILAEDGKLFRHGSLVSRECIWPPEQVTGIPLLESFDHRTDTLAGAHDFYLGKSYNGEVVYWHIESPYINYKRGPVIIEDVIYAQNIFEPIENFPGALIRSDLARSDLVSVFANGAADWSKQQHYAPAVLTAIEQYGVSASSSAFGFSTVRLGNERTYYLYFDPNVGVDPVNGQVAINDSLDELEVRSGFVSVSSSVLIDDDLLLDITLIPSIPEDPSVQDGDVPLPIWALVILGGGFLWRIDKRGRR
jgi:hypothetical protein